jgi:hypothetical protein
MTPERLIGIDSTPCTDLPAGTGQQMMFGLLSAFTEHVKGAVEEARVPADLHTVLARA